MKAVRLSILLLISVLWLGGCSRTVLHALYQAGVVVDDYRYGDLYRLGNLPQFKDPATPCPPRSVTADTTRTHLYVIGDSFTEPGRLSQTDFPVSRFTRIPWDQQQPVQLDSSVRNVLVIESVERHFREHAATLIQNVVVVNDSNGTINPKSNSVSPGQWLVETIRAKGIEERLEAVLFSHDVFLWVKEVKAHLTLTAFDRVNPMLSRSQDGQHLLLALDTDPANRLNAGTSPLPDTEVDKLVATVNEAATRYRSAGFDRVVLAIIPNKATLLDPTRPYNHLIERVQQHPGLRVPTVDVLTPYRQAGSVYAPGDSHWNCAGRALWLDAVTKQLR